MRHPFVLWRLLLAVVLVVPALVGPAAPAPDRAEAQGVSGIISFVRIIGGLRGRNRVYRAANAYIAERQEYYDRLRETARQQLQERGVGGLRDSQVAAYVKVVGLIEGERQAMIDFAESQKRAARAQFLDTVENAIVDRILASAPAQRALGALKDGVDSADNLIERGLESLATGGGALQEVQRVREIATRAGEVATLVGGEKGARFAGAMNRIAEVTRAPTAEIEDGLRQVQGELAPLGDEIEDLQNRGKGLTASQVAEPVVASVLPGGGDQSALDAIVEVLGAQVGRSDRNFRERAKAELIGQFLARCAAIGARYRESIARLEGAAAGEALSDAEATSPCFALDLEELSAEVEAGPDEEGDAQTGAGAPFEIVSAAPHDGHCADLVVNLQGGRQRQICRFELAWEVAYSGVQPPAEATCQVFQPGELEFDPEPFAYRQDIVQPDGAWSHSDRVSGGYAGPGIYPVQLVCELRSGAEGDGALIDSAEIEFQVDLTTVRDFEE